MAPGVQITSDSDLDAVLEEFKIKQARRNSTGPKYTCSISGCNESFKRLDQLDRHEYHHTGIKKHACSYEGCDKTYSIVTHLKRHLRSTHERPEEPQKTVKCSLPQCDKMFISTSNMTRHLREAHECPREYECRFCSLKFRQKMKLRRHEIVRHTQQFPFRCEKCQRGFYQQWQQESHQRSCRLYSCPQCEQQFEKWTLYTKHCRETLHGRERHKCEHCDKNYDKPSALSAHIAAKHPANAESTFSCTEPGCNRSYSYERNLRQHILTSHTGRRFECLAVNCQRCFSSAQNLSKHLQRDHTAKERQPAKKKQTLDTNANGVPATTRKRRRDAGKSARSQLSKLACVVLDKEVDKQVRLRQPSVLTSVAKELQEKQDEEMELERLLEHTLEDVC
ncbi:PREDICTED: transcription factor IIIA isoform X1 [Drosophila arizonae]|uniref:Transcription factor IIIA isoform X1 n=1 Tax=Drosophila arizonae TaxID=7263 RepID=A0ABM1PRA9_DROAR|nr:PREDICTED: transcription factor IIIA isoform X1 [Drosophila arizonae]